MGIILETKRLLLREMNFDDYDAIACILQNPKVMYAYEHTFSDIEVDEWIQRQIDRYQDDGFGLWAMIEKASNQLIGQCGITKQLIKDRQVLEIGYLLNQAYWHQGYAIEAAQACRTYAFHTLKADIVYSIIREHNIASQQVAKRNGMKRCDTIIKHYQGIDMPHDVYYVKP